MSNLEKKAFINTSNSTVYINCRSSISCTIQQSRTLKFKASKSAQVSHAIFGWLQYQEDGNEREGKSSETWCQLSLGSWASMSTLHMGHFLLVINHWSTHTWWKRCIQGRRLLQANKTKSKNCRSEFHDNCMWHLLLNKW